MKKTIVALVLALASLALGGATLLTTPVSANNSTLPSPPVFADHAQICLDNYNQCMKGCAGAASCSKQCKVNYDGCMRQNQNR